MSELKKCRTAITRFRLLAIFYVESAHFKQRKIFELFLFHHLPEYR